MRRLSLLAVGFEFDDPLAKKIVEFDDTLLDSAIETLEAIFGIAELPLQIEQPAVRGLVLGCLPLDQRL